MALYELINKCYYDQWEIIILDGRSTKICKKKIL